MAKAYKEWFKLLIKVPNYSTEFQSIWGNTLITIPFNNLLYRKGLIFVGDLLDETGRLLSMASLQAKYECRIMFTVYFALVNAIPRMWKDELLIKPRNYDVKPPPPMQKLFQCKKGTSAIRRMWSDKVDTNIPIGQIKWATEFAPVNIDWNFCYTVANKYKLNACTRISHFQVLHRTVMTNKKLNPFNLKQKDLCDICNVTDTISYLLYHCQNASQIWQQLFAWLGRNLTSIIYTDETSTLLGNPANESIVNTLFLMTKEAILKSRCKNTILNFRHLLLTFKDQMQIEIYIGTVKNNLAKVLGKWSHIHNALTLLQ